MAIFQTAHLSNRTSFSTSTTVAFTLSSVLAAFLYALLFDFASSYVKSPKHFPHRGWFITFGKNKVKAPLIGLNEKKDYREALARGSKLYPDRPFKIPHHPNEWVIIPYNMIDKIKNLPESKLSFQQGSYDFFMGWHTGITNHERAVANILKTGVNKLIDTVYSVVQDESMRTVLGQIGACEDWSEVFLLPITVNMVMAISQRVFVGEPLCRSQEWLQCIMKVTQNAFGSVPSLWNYNGITRPFAAWSHLALRSVRENRERAKQLLKPVLDQRLKEMESPDFRPKPDLMQFVLNATEKAGEGRSLDYQVNAVIGTGRAALFTTGITIYHLIFDLVTHPEYIKPLREEILELGDVPMNRANVGKLAKLDSFIRESQRWNKFMLVGTFRKVMEPFTLSDGTELYAGTYVGTNVQNAIFNHSTLSNPNVFDGFRFERLRKLEGKSHMYQSVQTAPDHLTYGIGSQACPGRFFAAQEARLVTARILMHYDFKLKKPYENGHPMDHVDGVMTTVDPNVEFLFKKRDPNTA